MSIRDALGESDKLDQSLLELSELTRVLQGKFEELGVKPEQREQQI